METAREFALRILGPSNDVAELKYAIAEIEKRDKAAEQRAERAETALRGYGEALREALWEADEADNAALDELEDALWEAHTAAMSAPTSPPPRAQETAIAPELYDIAATITEDRELQREIASALAETRRAAMEEAAKIAGAYDCDRLTLAIPAGHHPEFVRGFECGIDDCADAIEGAIRAAASYP